MQMEEIKKNRIVKKEIPKWLKEVQNNSWSPEILLSGLTITFIFMMNDHFYNFFAMLIQDFGANGIPLVSHIFFTASLNIIKIVLIFHLLMRGLWTGLIGLSYVYPDGVKADKLPYGMKNVKFSEPVDLVLKVEKICSLLFSFIFIYIILIIVIAFFYAPLLLIESFIIENTSKYMFLYAFVIMSPLIIMGFLKKSPFKLRFSNNIVNNIIYTLSTNAGNKLSILIFVLSFLISIPFSYSQISSFNYFNNTADKNIEKGLYVKDNENYNDERNNEFRVQKATINSYQIQNKIKLFIANYKADEVTFQKALEFPDSLKKSNRISEFDTLDLFSIYNVSIDSIVIPNINWVVTRHSHTNQKGVLTTISADSLSQGIHKLIIDKIVWSKKEKKIIKIDSWDEILFYKN